MKLFRATNILTVLFALLTCGTLAHAQISVSGTVFTDQGVTNIGAGKTVSVSINGAPVAGSNDTDGSGNYSISGLTVNANDVLALFLDDEVEDGVVVTVGDGANLTGIDIYQDYLIVRHDNAGSVNDTSLQLADDSGDTDISSVYSFTGADLTTTNLYILNAYSPGGIVTTGNFVANANFTSANRLNVTGDFTNNRGSALSYTGNLYVQGSSPTINDPHTTFIEPVFSGAAKTVDIVGSITSSQFSTVNFFTDINLNSGTINVGNSINVSPGDSLTGNGSLEFVCTSYCGSAPFGTIDIDIVVNSPNSSTIQFNQDVNMASKSVVVTQGTLSTGANQFQAAGGVTVQSGAVFRSFGAETFTVPVLQAGSTFEYVNNTASDITLPTSIVSFTNLLLRASSSGGFILPNADISVSETLTVRDITVTYDADNNVQTNGLVVEATGTLVNNGTGNLTLGGNATIDGAISFNSAGGSLVGGDADSILIRSTTGGVQRNWQGAGTFNMTDIDVQDQRVVGGTPATISVSDGTNNGNNTNWVFESVLAGTVYEDDRATPVSGVTVSVSINGAAVTASADTDGSGNFTISGLPLSAGDIVVLFIDDEVQDGAVVTEVDGGSLTGVEIYDNYLILRHDNGGALTNADLALADNSADADLLAVFSEAAGNVTVSVSNLSVEGAFSPGGDVSTNTVRISGSGNFSPEGNTVTAAGNWFNTGSGVFTAGTSTVEFDHAGSGVNIREQNGFYNLRISGGASSNFSASNQDINVSNDLEIVSGILDTNDTNDQAITVGRDLIMTGGQLQGNDSTITIGRNATFDGAGDSEQLNRASVVLTGTGSLTYSNLSRYWENGFNNLITGQSGNLTTMFGTWLSVRNVLTVGSGELTGGTWWFLHGANPLAFDPDANLTVGGISFAMENTTQTIPTLINGYDCNIAIDENNVVVQQTGNVSVTGGHYLRVAHPGISSRTQSWDTNGFDLTVNGDLFVGTGNDTAQKHLDITNSTVEVKGDFIVEPIGAGTTQASITAANSVLRLTGAGAQNLTLSGSSLNYVDIINTAAASNVTFTDEVSLTESLAIQDGQVVFGAGDLTLQDNSTSGTALTLLPGTILSNTSTGSLFIGGAVNNSGTINFDSSDDAGDGISVLSTSSGAQRNWQGSGSFSFTDVQVRDQAVVGGTPANISVTSSTNLGNNVNWIFDGAVLTGVSVSLSDYVAEQSSAATIGFTNSNPVPANGRIAVTFPSGFDISGVSGATSTDMDGTLNIQGVSGQTLTLQRAGGSQLAGSTVVDDLVISGVVNPSAAGTTGGFSLETQDNAGSALDTGSAAGVNILPNTFTLSGVVRNAEGNPLSGVLVVGGALGNRTTDGSGVFDYGSLTAGTSYSLSFTLTNYGFSPLSGTLNADTTLSVTGTNTGTTITGVVTLSNINRTPLAGATVTDGTVSTTTGSDGSYSLSGVANGNTVRAVLEGYKFEEPTSGADAVVVTGDDIYPDAPSPLVLSGGREAHGVEGSPDIATPERSLDMSRHDVIVASDKGVDFVATPALGTTSYSAWNTFIGMTAILELSNNHSLETTFTVKLRDALGEVITAFPVTLASNEKRDIILNDLLGRVDEYGIVEVSSPHTAYSGRVTQYRTNLLRVFEFAYAIDLSIGMTGESAVPYNSYQPSLNREVDGFIVTNWLSIINLDSNIQPFEITRYRSDGAEISNNVIFVSPFGRTDIEGGHQDGEDAGFHKIEPVDPSARYLAFLTRYGDFDTGYHYATNLVAKQPDALRKYIPITNVNNSDTWLEISNVSDQLEEISLEIVADDGTQLLQETFGQPARTQRHFNASTVLGSFQNGYARTSTRIGGRVVVHSLTYYEAKSGIIDALDDQGAGDVFGDELSASYNTFLNTGNWLKLTNITEDFQTVTLTAQGTSFSYSLAPNTTELVPLGSQVAADSYGEVSLKINSYGSILSELVRAQNATSTSQTPRFVIGSMGR